LGVNGRCVAIRDVAIRDVNVPWSFSGSDVSRSHGIILAKSKWSSRIVAKS
jgi:hypothetical protein